MVNNRVQIVYRTVSFVVTRQNCSRILISISAVTFLELELVKNGDKSNPSNGDSIIVFSFARRPSSALNRFRWRIKSSGSTLNQISWWRSRSKTHRNFNCFLIFCCFFLQNGQVQPPAELISSSWSWSWIQSVSFIGACSLSKSCVRRTEGSSRGVTEFVTEGAKIRSRATSSKSAINLTWMGEPVGQFLIELVKLEDNNGKSALRSIISAWPSWSTTVKS